MRHIRTMYWTNINPKTISGQAKVFAKFGLALRQDERSGMRHGTWLTETLYEIGDEDTILFLDIDCFPLDAAIVEEAFRAAEAGRIYGVAHVTNHRDPNFIFAGPMFLCLSKQTWLKLGKPHPVSDAQFDAGGLISWRAKELGVPVDLIYPNYCAISRWKMAGWGSYGIATIYGGRIFHLFESRRDPGLAKLFDHAVDAVLAGREPDPIWMFDWANSPGVRLVSWIRKWGLKLARVRDRALGRYRKVAGAQSGETK